jgi:hypothetical protein
MSLKIVFRSLRHFTVFLVGWNTEERFQGGEGERRGGGKDEQEAYLYEGLKISSRAGIYAADHTLTSAPLEPDSRKGFFHHCTVSVCVGPPRLLWVSKCILQ